VASGAPRGKLPDAHMVATHRKLDALLQTLTDSGEDPRRLEIVRRALNFKRAWVELAEGLTTLQRSRAYEKWGYTDLQEYCTGELHIRPATTEKLLLSLSTVRDHAPQMLEQGAPHDVPSIDSVDYFSRALDLTGPGAKDASRRLDAPEDVVEELRAAVFDEGQSVGELRKRFNPVLRPKPEEQEAAEQARKTRTAAARLLELVRNLDGLSEKRVARIEASVDALMRDLDKLAPPPEKKAKKAEPAEAEPADA